MAKTTAPLWGLDASGTIGEAITFSKWKGVKYARRHVIPSNPQTAEQTKTRSAFSWLSDAWKYMPSLVVDAYEAAIARKPLTARNQWVKTNLRGLRGQSDITSLAASPGAAGGIIAASLALVPDEPTDQIEATLTAPDLPDGWTIEEARFLCIRDQDPSSEFAAEVYSEAISESPYTATFTDLQDGQTYVVSAFFKFLKADGQVAYGPSLTESASV